jgi:malate dehydrogenase (oxaloacetate-decarboxylating)(NADP+)
VNIAPSGRSRFLPGVSDFAALSMMITSKGSYFIADTRRPNPERRGTGRYFAGKTQVQRFNIAARLRVTSDFGSYDTDLRARCAAPPRF